MADGEDNVDSMETDSASEGKSESPPKRPENLCCYSQEECDLDKLKGFDFCHKHILEDKASPFKPCSFVSKTNGKKCMNPAPKLENGQKTYCLIHTRDSELRKVLEGRTKKKKRKLSGQHDEPARPSSKPGRPPGVTRTYTKRPKVLDLGPEYRRDDVLRVESSWHGDYESDTESLDNDMDDPLRHAGVWSAEEVTKMCRDKLLRLRSLYMSQFERLKHVYKSKRRKYLLATNADENGIPDICYEPNQQLFLPCSQALGGGEQNCDIPVPDVSNHDRCILHFRRSNDLSVGDLERELERAKEEQIIKEKEREERRRADQAAHEAMMAEIAKSKALAAAQQAQKLAEGAEISVKPTTPNIPSSSNRTSALDAQQIGTQATVKLQSELLSSTTNPQISSQPAKTPELVSKNALLRQTDSKVGDSSAASITGGMDTAPKTINQSHPTDNSSVSNLQVKPVSTVASQLPTKSSTPVNPPSTQGIMQPPQSVVPSTSSVSSSTQGCPSSTRDVIRPISGVTLSTRETTRLISSDSEASSPNGTSVVTSTSAGTTKPTISAESSGNNPTKTTATKQSDET